MRLTRSEAEGRDAHATINGPDRIETGGGRAPPLRSG